MCSGRRSFWVEITHRLGEGSRKRDKGKMENDLWKEKGPSDETWHTTSFLRLPNGANEAVCPSYLAEGAQRMYMHPTLFPRLERVKNTSVASSSRWEYWNSARSVRWSFQRPSPEAFPPTELPPPPPLERRPDVPVGPAGTGPASRSGRRA